MDRILLCEFMLLSSVSFFLHPLLHNKSTSEQPEHNIGLSMHFLCTKMKSASKVSLQQKHILSVLTPNEDRIIILFHI